MKSFEYIANISGDIMFFCSLKGEFTFVNHFMERLLGMDSKEIIGKHFTELVTEEKRDGARNHFKSILENQKVSDYYEFPIKTASGNELWVDQKQRICI